MKEEYEVHKSHICCDFFVDTDDKWERCPKCGLRPKQWIFDNGRSTACGCGNSQYHHFSIYAESVGSVVRRTGGVVEYDKDELRKNWNHYCKTGEVLFDRNGRKYGG